MDTKIRNFSIIAHIDHGKSTLADRMLEITKTIEKRSMKDQVLDTMDLERERGITIKMQPVSMFYTHKGVEYTLNLIDTPGHIDFSYEVSRALRAVEGALLLVDATQGVQAQTLTTLYAAKEAGLVIIPVISKIDSPLADIESVSEEIVSLTHCSKEDIICVSGKTGEGVENLIQQVIERVRAPSEEVTNAPLRALIFDFLFSKHRGVVTYVRIMEGSIKAGDTISFFSTKQKCNVQEVGVFQPTQTPVKELREGMIGYVVTGIKTSGGAFVGDTLIQHNSKSSPLSGYKKVSPVIWASIYTENQDEFPALQQALERLAFSDSSLYFEEESSQVLGRGFRCGFLGMLHLEIVIERLKREHGVSVLVMSSTISYRVHTNKGIQEIYAPTHFPDAHAYTKVEEQWVTVEIIIPHEYLGKVMTVAPEYELVQTGAESFYDRIHIQGEMPLRELMRNFFDTLKSVTAGYGSLSYAFKEYRPALVDRMDIVVAEEEIPAFSTITSHRRAYEEAKKLTSILKEELPRQQFVLKIQARYKGRIIASSSLSAMRKDVTAKLYGGDVTRKMKLLEKQKKGKKKAADRGKVHIPHDIFLKVVKRKNIGD